MIKILVLTVTFLLVQFVNSLAQSNDPKDLPSLVFQSGPNDFPLNFDVSKDGSLFLVASSTQVLLIDIQKGAIVGRFISKNTTIDKCQFSHKGDSILVVSHEYVIRNNRTQEFRHLDILDSKSFKGIDSIASDFLDVSGNSQHLILHSVTNKGTAVKLISLLNNKTLLEYTEKDNILNDGEIVGERVQYKYTKYSEEDGILNFLFNEVGINNFHISSDRALISIKGITRFWDLNNKKHLSRIDTIDIEKANPLSIINGHPILELWNRYKYDQYYLTDENTAERINKNFIQTYNDQGKRLTSDTLTHYWVPSGDGDGMPGIKKKDTFRVQYIKEIGDGNIISKILGQSYFGSRDTLQNVLIHDAHNRLENSNIKLFNNFLISADREGLKFWNLSTGQNVVEMRFKFIETLKDTSFTWATVHNDYGYFDVDNLENANQVLWKFPGEFSPFPLEIFMKDFYLPQLLYKTLQGQTIKKPVRDFRTINRNQPEIKISGFKQVNDSLCMINIDLLNDIETYSIHIFRDQKLVKILPEISDGNPANFAEWKQVSQMPKNDPKLKNITIPLPLQSLKKTTLTVYGFNNDRVKSLTSEITFPIEQKTAKKGKLFILTIAVNDNADIEKKLNHTVKECEEFYLKLSNMVDKSEFSDIKRDTLLSQVGGVFQTFARTTTKEEIQKKFVELKRKIRPEDNLVIFHSGHGLIDPEGKFYLVPYDFDRNQPYKSSVSGTELSSWIEGIDAKSIFVFIDACYSGGIEDLEYIPGPFGDPGFGQLSYNKIIPVLTSARKEEKSYTMGLGIINQRLKVKTIEASSQNLFDLMLNISLHPSADTGQKPQFLFWGKNKLTNIKLKKENE